MKTEFTKSSSSYLRLARRVFGPLALLLVLVQPVSAATLRWTGGHATSSDWSRAANWDTGTTPVDGDTLVFPAGSARPDNNNDIAGLQLTAIRFSGASGGYVLAGNGVVLANGITATNSAGANFIELTRITLGANLFFTVAQNGAELIITSEVRLNGFDLTCNTVGDLTLSGVITGTGNLFKNNNSTLTLNGPAANTFTGDTFVNGGVLVMGKSSGLAVPHRLIVGDGPGGAHTDQARNLSGDQVNQVTVNASGLWDLNGFVEVVDDLELKAGGDIETGATGNLRLAFNADVSVTPSLLPIPDASRIAGHLELLVGTHTFTVGEGSTLTSDSTELVIDAAISGLGGITKAGQGDLLLSGNNSFESAVIVDGGELRISRNTALGTTTFGTTVNGDATLWMQGNVEVAGEALTLNSTGVTNGLNSRPALRASGLDNAWFGRVTFQIDSRVGVDTNGFLNFSRGLAGAGSLVKESPGTLRLSVFDVSDFNGSVYVNTGLLELNSITPMPEFTLFIVGDGIGGPHSDVLRNLVDFQVGEDPAMTSHGGNVHVYGSGFWDLDNHSDSAASASLFDGGDIDTGATGTLSVHFYLQGNSGPPPFYDTARISGNIELVDPGVGGENVEIKALEGVNLSADASDLVIDARVSGGGLFKSGAGDLLLSGNNSFSGTITIDNGELRIGHPNALGVDFYLVTVRSNATLWLQGDIVATRPLVLDSTGQTGGLNSRPALRASGTGNEWAGDVTCQIDSLIGVVTNGFLKLSGVLRGTGGLLKEDDGTLRLSVPDLNSFGGDIYVNAGIVELDHGYNPVAHPLNRGTIVVGDGIGGPHADVLRNLSDYQVGADLPLPSNFSYTMPLIVNSSGLWDLNGHRDVTTKLTLHDGGDVTTGANGIIAILIGLTADPGPAPDNDAARISGNVELVDGFIPVEVQEGDAGSDEAGLIISARLSGEGLVKSGAGNLLLSGDNTFAGPVLINNGELRAGHPQALGTGTDAIIVSSNATFWLQGDISIANRILWLDSSGQTGPNGDAALKVTGTNSWLGQIRLERDIRIGIGPDSVFRALGAMIGSGGIIKEGPGSLLYVGSLHNTYLGTTRVTGGRLALWKEPGTRCFSGDLVVGDGLGGADADLVECLSDGLAATNAHVTVNTSGLLLVKNEARFGSIGGNGHVQAEAVLNVGENDRSTQFNGPITGAGVINKFGNGTLTLTSSNTIAGLLVFNGRLLANGSQPNTAVGVLDEGVLGGIGRVGVVLATDGAIAPGASPGELKTGNLTLDPDVIYRVELDGLAPAGYDRLKVEGTVALGGARLVLLPSFIPAAGETFTLIDNDGSDAVSGTFNGLAEGATIEAGGVRFAVSYRGGDGSNNVLLTVLGPPPPCPEPVLSILLWTNSVELSWPSCPSNFYQLAWTTNFQQWQMLTPPLAAPETNGIMTWTTPTSSPYQFFQLVIRPLTNAPVPTNAGIYAGRTFTHDGITRQYRINIPESYTNGLPAPLMLALHGHDQTADSFAANVPDLATYANNAGVILVFPDGTRDQRGTGWNILDPTPENPVDDVGFLLALIDELDETLNIDRKRIYGAGFSNGGQMCHRLAARTTNVFAAFAAVGSAVAGEFGTGTLVYQPPPAEPNSMLIVNALNDCKRPYLGGTNVDGVLQPPARDSVSHWTNANFCTPSPVLTTNVFVTNHINRVFADCAGPYPPFNAPKTNYVIREHYQITCTPGTEVLFVTLSDGGHSWPEVADNVGFDTSREVLEFCMRHCRCDALAATEPLVIPTLPGKYELRLCDQNFNRLFRLQIPAGYNPAVAAPLVFVFHGGGQTAESFSSLHPALFTKCNTEGMLLVLPQALPNPLFGDTLWSEKPFDVVVNDVAFVTNLLEQLDGALNVDRSRVYATGFSSGGDFSHWLGSTTTGLLAAIAPVCHTMGWVDRSTGTLIVPPPPLEPMAVMMVRGGMDPKRPFNGSGTAFPAQADAQYWASGSSCVGAPAVTSAPGVMQWQYAACAGTTEVILVRVDNMAHEWPDGPPFNANTQIIDFLLTHSR